tara:strand:+ start:22336 stop:22563 length:228 start_codon:yes stop_codon:yes gene_type:complete
MNKNNNIASTLLKLKNKNRKNKSTEYIKKSKYFPNDEKNILLNDHNMLMNKSGRGFDLKFLISLENKYKKNMQKR